MKKTRLEDIDRNTPYRVPDNYFSELTKDIQSRVSNQPRRSWILVPHLKWAIAASFIMVIGLMLYLRPSTNQPNVEDMLAQISEQDLMDYLDMNDFTESDLLEGLTEDEIDALWDDEESLDGLEIDDENMDELLMEYETDFDKYL